MRRFLDSSAIEIAEKCLECGQTPQPGVEQSNRAGVCATFHMVIRGGNLNQTLEELLDVRFGRKPELLPRLMRFPEFFGVEVMNTFDEVRRKIGFAQSFGPLTSNGPAHRFSERRGRARAADVARAMFRS